MQCDYHPQKKPSHKCQNCLKLLCPECTKLHKKQSHSLTLLLQLTQTVKQKISQQLNKINKKIKLLTTQSEKDYENGQSIIEECMTEVIGFVKKLFTQLKQQYRGLTDRSWREENVEVVEDLEQKRNVFEGWRDVIDINPQKAINFDIEQIYNINRIESEEEVDDSVSISMGNSHGLKIAFNENALRKANQSLARVIHTEMKGKNKRKVNKPISKKSSKQIAQNSYYSQCKFIENTNVLLEYILQSPESPDSQPFLTRTQFRQFSVPFRCSSISIGSSIYLIGGYNKQQKSKKEIFFYERNYTSMRVIGLLKQGRVAHATCAHEDVIYVFGGRGALSLEAFNLRTKTSQIVATLKKQIIGASMIPLGNKLWIIGGKADNQAIFCYDIAKKLLKEVLPMNSENYPMPISPILQAVSDTEIVIIGGYFTTTSNSSSASSINNYILCLDTKLCYFSVFSKDEVIYPIISNSSNCTFKNNCIIGMVDMKRQNNKHGPNLPVVFVYDLKQETMRIDTIGV